jgi:RNA polymerase sigma-70 factor (ECF subfamily)
LADRTTLRQTPAHTDPAHAIDIGRALDDLPPLQREVVVLHLVEGFSFLEIGRLTGVSLFTAAARYRLARARLRTALAGKGKDT